MRVYITSTNLAGWSWEIRDADTGTLLDDVTAVRIEVSATGLALAYLTRVAQVADLDVEAVEQ